MIDERNKQKDFGLAQPRVNEEIDSESFVSVKLSEDQSPVDKLLEITQKKEEDCAPVEVEQINPAKKFHKLQEASPSITCQDKDKEIIE